MIRFYALAVALLASGSLAAAEPARLPASGLKAGDRFGSAVAIGTGAIAVGAYLADGGRGAVHLFTRVENGWREERLSGGPGEWFGFDLAFDTTGTTLLIGAPSPGQVGKIYLYDDRGLQPPVSGGAAGDEFGSSVSVDDGWFAVGARGANQRAGRIYVFQPGRQPTLLPMELPGPSAGAELGQSLSLRGRTLAAGAPLPGKDGKSPGIVYLSTRDAGDVWTPLRPISTSGLNAGSAFGYSVAVQDGKVVVGAPLLEGRGAVYKCDGRACDLYLQGQRGDQMGVAVAAETGKVVSGARGVGGNQGAVYLNLARLPKADVKGAELGFGVAVRGETIVAGAFREEGTGAAYVFEPDTTPCEPEIVLTSPTGLLTTQESGTSLTFKVRLTCQPVSIVEVTPTLAGDMDEATVTPASLQFSTSDWNVDKEVTVSGADDGECDGARAYSLQIGSSSIDLTNLDDDICLDAIQVVRITPDDVAVFDVTVRNLGDVRLEDGTYLIELPDDVQVITATVDRGVVTVDHLENTVAWNGSLPVGGEALVTILAPLEPDAAPAYDPSP